MCRLPDNATGHTLDALLGELAASVKERVAIDERVATPDEILGFIRFVELLLVRRQSAAPLTVALAADFAHVPEAERRAALRHLLELDRSMREHNAQLSLSRTSLGREPSRIVADSGAAVRFTRGSLCVHKPAEHAIGSGGTQALLHCHATEMEFYRDD